MFFGSRPSTQNFLQISEIKDGVVILKNGGLRAILMCSSVNFALLSSPEQDSLIYRFQSFLNSVDFPIQIAVNSRQINLDKYLMDLNELSTKQENELLKIQTQSYIEFVKSLIQFSNIISKYFYVVIPFDPVNVKKSFSLFGAGRYKPIYTQNEFEEHKNQLWLRLKHLKIGLESMMVKAEPLNTEELIELFYNLYNPDDKMKETTLNVYEKTQNTE